MKHLTLLLLSFMLVSCEFEKADYHEFRFRYGDNIDFGEDVGNQTGSTFDFGSSYKSSSSRTTPIYMGDTGKKPNDGKGSKKDYSRHYRGSMDED